ncbi:BglG family transcription antiterminator [Enterococcus xiangfangensis]|uniref:Ascorbate-specific PTS system EIIA component n=1 Tax=Enterococcus xiangfangensis TaxID=1296537 RepID=A0ABU3FBT5_9ENTE|nr:BglG family transcription antiterminator [Enterococcus xiangfangensis]MBM7712929.1 transcriptional antiterminator/mannitol/fructose-specific phosphotransferase system IIA component (Ntr-type) [Enterococcus xiangfangensis]MDT2760124.1 BglG family transcription antiterminator [Enterococcus xiangfangensis]NBK07643.1 PRD domain-containing protein [Enterococcus asini]
MVMIDQRTRLLMKKLIEKPINSQQNLMDQLSLSKSQIDYALEKASAVLTEAGLEPLFIDNLNVELSEENKNYFLTLFSQKKIYDYYELSSEERKKYIFLMLLFHYKEYLSLNHFIQVLKVGKTTFTRDIKKVEEELKNHNLEIIYTRKEGYQLVGDEAKIRYHLMRMILEDSSLGDNLFLYNYFLSQESEIDVNEISKIIKELMDQFNIKLVENRFNEFSYMLIFLVPRLSKNWTEFYTKYNYQTFFKMQEYQFSVALLKSFNITNEYASLYVCGWILGMAMGTADQTIPDYSIINELVERIFNRFEMLSGVRFRDKQSAKKQLFSHFRPAYYRLFFHLPIVNYLHEKILVEFPDLFEIVKETMRPIEVLFGTDIPDEEITFLTIHFASLLDDYDEYPVRQKVGLIVCPNGIGSSAIIYNELKNIFPEMILIGPVETNELTTVTENYDMIFTTVPNIRLYSQKKPIYVVNPIMSIDEKYHLIHEIQNTSDISPRRYKTEELLEIIDKYADIKDKEQLGKALESYLHENRSSKSKGNVKAKATVNSELNLLDILKPEYIQLDVMTRSWEEAFYVAATPLVDAGVFGRRYIDTIIQTTRREGPYMVIMDKVALPHARPEDGTKKVGLGITVLKNEIKVMGKTPIKYIFTLSAVDNKKHLAAIAELVSLLDKKEFFNILDHSNQSTEVYHWLEKELAKV